jgi:hypothetical protein
MGRSWAVALPGSACGACNGPEVTHSPVAKATWGPGGGSFQPLTQAGLPWRSCLGAGAVPGIQAVSVEPPLPLSVSRCGLMEATCPACWAGEKGSDAVVSGGLSEVAFLTVQGAGPLPAAVLCVSSEALESSGRQFPACEPQERVADQVPSSGPHGTRLCRDGVCECCEACENRDSLKFRYCFILQTACST